MKFFHSPRSCSLGIHIILEELGIEYDLNIVNVREGEQRRPEYLAINPLGKVPTIVRDDEGVLTEFQTIAFWLSRTYPDAKLMPEDVSGQARVLELLDYIVASLHMRGATLVIRPSLFAETPEGQAEVQTAGRAALVKGLAELDGRLGDNEYLLGDTFTAADAAAFYLLSWMPGLEIDRGANLNAYFDRMLARPAVQRAVAV
ncbi:glutathione S-transferase [Monaibacterium marinum]|uniref:Glutathione S-transferase n=1 Tax=Pontivivens marinum TaxID=1690039 RepID=A0A2C9CX49_9RHOB|nr:glutathione S-transferase family protein [Monaibacterium marinum]SOH95009.1 glutathione S-transferase [Monaibacterium marinum]